MKVEYEEVGIKGLIDTRRVDEKNRILLPRKYIRADGYLIYLVALPEGLATKDAPNGYLLVPTRVVK